jgi:hypothetical protein
LRRELNVDLCDIVGDFIRDESDNYWLMGIKAFKISIKEKKVVEIRRIVSNSLERRES